MQEIEKGKEGMRLKVWKKARKKRILEKDGLEGRQKDRQI